MPHEVTMPQLGMAQDAGRIVAWLKQPGEQVARGDALFEVETDKATMEVEAQAAGYLTDIAAAAGTDVPVGQVIARISDTPEGAGDGDSEAPGAGQDAARVTGPRDAEGSGAAVPDGAQVIMPALGMAQDTGLIVAWHKAPGEAVNAADILFEVETDKATMEVEAGHDGFVAALLAEPGEEAPVGAAIAVIAPERPETPVRRSLAGAAPAAAAAPPHDAAAKPSERTDEPPPVVRPAPAPVTGRILASPRARRLALEQGLDLARLAEAGHPQPYHVRDLEALRALPAAAQAPAPGRRLTAQVPAGAFDEFAAWAAETHGLGDADALLAGFAAASLPAGPPATVVIARFGESRRYAVPAGRALSAVAASGGEQPDLILRDRRGTALRHVEVGAEAAPVLTLLTDDAGLSITLECGPAQLDASGALSLLEDFAGRMAQPLRHLL